MSYKDLSPEARKARYQYNKKYQDAYWERRSQKTDTETTETATDSSTKTVKRTRTKKTENVVKEVKIGFPVIPEPSYPVVCRDTMTDAQYIDALERSNKTMAGENRRLVRLLTTYQEIIRQGIYASFTNPEILDEV